MKEKIHQPSHYMANGEETIVKIVRELGIMPAIDFCKGNVIKYRDRAEYKGQKESDLQKIEEYTKMANDLQAIRDKATETIGWENIVWYGEYLLSLVKEWSENGHSLEGIKWN